MCHTAYFNPRPPHGERRFIPDIPIIIDIFQSTPPHGERLSPIRMEAFFPSFQSTPPAWGATFFGDGFILVCNISIHAPRMGSDLVIRLRIHNIAYFNPRSRMGSDLHTLHRRARWTYFNPRSRMGSDLLAITRKRCVLIFQSTLPHGERRVT